jgi:hypothetical protein
MKNKNFNKYYDELANCNHHSFFVAGDIEEDTTECESCGKTMKIDSRGN